MFVYLFLHSRRSPNPLFLHFSLLQFLYSFLSFVPLSYCSFFLILVMSFSDDNSNRLKIFFAARRFNKAANFRWNKIFERKHLFWKSRGNLLPSWNINLMLEGNWKMAKNLVIFPKANNAEGLLIVSKMSNGLVHWSYWSFSCGKISVLRSRS